MSPAQIEKKYKARAKRILASIAEALRQEGLHPSSVISDWKDDDLRLDLVEGPAEDHDDQIDIAFEFCASENWDGSEGGYNFGIQATHASGRMLGGLTPFNYSGDCWVSRKDPAAIEERFQILERADVSELVYIIQKFRREQADSLSRG